LEILCIPSRLSTTYLYIITLPTRNYRRDVPPESRVTQTSPRATSPTNTRSVSHLEDEFLSSCVYVYIWFFYFFFFLYIHVRKINGFGRDDPWSEVPTKHIYKHARTSTRTTHHVWTDCISICIQVGEGGGRLDGYLFCTTACNASTSLQLLYRAFQATTEKLFIVVV
jgi:hypothetical protein